MRIIGARTISAKGQRWIVQEVAEIGIAFAEEPEEDPHAPAASTQQVTFTNQQSGLVRRGML